jgi:penicillin-binding protein, 1A family
MRSRTLLVAAVTAIIATQSASAQEAPRSTGEAWTIVPLPQSTLVFARDGKTLLGEIGHEFRTSVPLKTLHAYVSQAFIAVEDQRFYEHDGVDVRAVAGAIVGKIVGNNRGGGSTITQQLVGYMHPDIIDRREVTVSRKYREQNAAREMEKHYTKQQILEAYLNQINLGHGWYGVDAASRHYFGHPASQLTLAEAATLAGLPKSQPQYDPIAHPAAAKARRNLILGMMADQGYITPGLAAKTKALPVETSPSTGAAVEAGYFVDAVRQHAERAGYRVMNGGYRIYTTLDPVLQRDAVVAVVEGTNRIERQKGYRHLTLAAAIKKGSTDYLQAMAVAIDPYTGDVRALVGGRDYARSQFDRAINMARQPGSSFKPIVYTKGIEDSVPPNTIIPDTALAIELPTGEIWRPGEADNKFDGPMTMRTGLMRSRNMVAIQVGLQVGMDSVAALARRMGITTPINPVPASAIGASEVHPIDLVAAYTAFANDGRIVQPRFITRIDDANGRTAFLKPASTPQQVLDPRVAFIVRDMLKDVAERGSGTQARAAVPDEIPIAGKTGTTNDNADLWFVGMTPEVVAGVWVGFDKRKTVAYGAYGGALAAPIWGDMIAKYYEGRSTRGWGPPPDGLIYAELDRDSGLLATPATPWDKRYVEYFLPGTEPAALQNNPWKMPQWGPLFLPLRAPTQPR